MSDSITNIELPESIVEIKYPISEGYRAILNTLPTTSDQIRRMAADGYTRTQTADTLQIIYQHVRNVLVTPTKRPRTPKFVPMPVSVMPAKKYVTVDLSDVIEETDEEAEANRQVVAAIAA